MYHSFLFLHYISYIYTNCIMSIINITFFIGQPYNSITISGAKQG
ncbi:hypothetical protein BACPEC_03113 [[Bacteroides] pectinophilus ATCC 43243]|uniref:Uncharacterized protein n=1 Tax=[Bacteroides] pectinophilus ATCC 43243 TaxID=483218 RepID=B7AWL2_9FIRM|nr:hypothetical protein BACPEC_03113 [[Bacteroides] pectinophilus ATCC 43243]